MTTASLANGIKVIKKAIEELPYSPGIYKMIDAQGNVLYIGKAKVLPKRVSSYAQLERLPNRLKRMVSLICKIETLTTENEAQALILEASLIKSIKPKFNIALKDDKSFPYIVIEENNEFPRITKYRGKKVPGNSYYGPFASAGSVNKMILELQKLFRIRPCSDNFFASRSRPCLQYQIKRCSGPCVGKIDKTKYLESIKQVKDFLSGKSTNLQEIFTTKMQEASVNLEYEKAAEYRDKLKLLNQIQAKSLLRTDNAIDVDIFAYYQEDDTHCIQVFFIRNGYNFGNKEYYPDFSNLENPEEGVLLFITSFYQQRLLPKEVWVNTSKDSLNLLGQALRELSNTKISVKNPSSGSNKHLMEFAYENAKQALSRKKRELNSNKKFLVSLKQLFELPKTPKRVEVYDNSHTFGEYPVGCMVVAEPQGFNKKAYRTFIIKELKNKEIDDYSMLNEVLTRRLKRLNDENYPDILLIDGGKGQLSIATQVMEKLGITDIKVVCIAKGPDRNAGREVLFTQGHDPIALPKGSPILNYLRKLRDEAHRFAIEFHRKRRSKAYSRSSIQDIPGIGSHRKTLLLNFFGSLETIKQASFKDLCKVKGISKKTAQQVYNYLH